MYHGGADINPDYKGITYLTPNKKMAESYISMTNDRFGQNSGALREVSIDIRKPAPESVVLKAAKALGIDTEAGTPASVFDAELHGTKVLKLRDTLREQGYDGAVLDDIAYGENITDKSYIPFSNTQIKRK